MYGYLTTTRITEDNEKWLVLDLSGANNGHSSASQNTWNTIGMLSNKVCNDSVKKENKTCLFLFRAGSFANVADDSMREY